MAKTTNQLLTQLGDDSSPVPHRAQMLVDVMAQATSGESSAALAAAQEIFRRLENAAVDEIAQKRSKILHDILEQMESAPIRPARFIRMTDITSSSVPHMLVSLDNGELAYVVAPNQDEAKTLHLGDRIMIDAHSKIMLHNSADGLYFGTEAKLQRWVDERHLEIVNDRDEHHVILAGPDMVADIKANKIPPGSTIIVSRCGNLALRALPPPEKGTGHFRFLDRGGIPNISVEKDIGAPPPIIDRVAKHVREEMLRPELRRRFHLRPCLTCLLEGPSGTGKTLAVQAIHRQLYEIMSEVTGIPIAELPPRVFKFRNSKILSMWLGESDKNADRIFDEVEEAAGHKVKLPSGEERLLPVMVVMEEADGMGRARGEEAIYDRIMTTILQRLDPNGTGLGSKLVVFLSTTNEKNIIDPAMLRRIGGTIETFGRLNQEAFEAVLRKHIEGLPAENGQSSSPKKAWAHIIRDLSQWLFLPGNDAGVLELSYQGYSHPEIKYRRDFLTGALIDRAVQQAATQAWEVALAKDDPNGGVTREQLVAAFHHQIKCVVDQVCPQTASHYLDLPEGVRVTGVKRIQVTN